MKKSVIFCILTAVVAIAMTGCGKDPEEKTPVITITTQPAATTTVTAGSITGSLTVAASVTEGATLSYQWYSNTQNSATGGTSVAGAASATFAIPTSHAPSTYYYFCEVSATGGATPVRSNVATVTVNPSQATLVSIAVTKQPEKLVYTVGDTFDPAGMEVEATYSDQSKAKVNNADLAFDYNFLTAGVNKTVIVKYLDKEDRNSVKVTVNEPVPDITLTITGEYVYNGAAIVPQHTVKAGDATLTTGQDFDLSYGDAGNTNAGEVTVTATGKGKYEGKSDTKTFTIEKCPITVTADNMEKTFWDDDPELTFTVAPPLFGDDAFTGELEREEGDEVGIYAILQGDLSAGDNYEITFVDGEFEICYFLGEGTEAKPYEIGRVEQLAKFRDFVNAGTEPFANTDIYYKLTADISLSTYNTGAGWTPIGSINTGRLFSGHFEGNGKIVSGLFIYGSLTYVGLFGYINGGTVLNLGVDGAVRGNSNVGGLAGGVINGNITNCYANVEISYPGNVTQNFGGLIGSISSTNVTNCYTTGTVNGYGFVGGVVGNVNGSGSSITNCYATGTVGCGGNTVGGVAGAVGSGNSVANCAALNLIIIGGISGRVANGGTLNNNVAWDGMAAVGGATFGTGAANNKDGEDKTAAELKQKATYEALGWDFTTDWKIEEGVSYPKLKWEE